EPNGEVLTPVISQGFRCSTRLDSSGACQGPHPAVESGSEHPAAADSVCRQREPWIAPADLRDSNQSAAPVCADRTREGGGPRYGLCEIHGYRGVSEVRRTAQVSAPRRAASCGDLSAHRSIRSWDPPGAIRGLERVANAACCQLTGS